MSETVTKINGIPLDVLLEIERLINGNPKLLENMANGYAFGYEKGYADAIDVIHKKICQEITPPKYKEAGALEIPKIKLEPYKRPENDASVFYRWGRPITEVPQEIVAGIKLKQGGERNE